jgi:hypothetical protein
MANEPICESGLGIAFVQVPGNNRAVTVNICQHDILPVRLLVI